MIFNTTRERNIRLLGKGDPIVGMEPFNPATYAAYIQDKMEFEGLVVNLGVRYEVLAPGESFGRAMDHVTWNHYNSLTRWRNVPIVDSPTQTAISPRLGISHPITERSTIRFFTGRFHQFIGLQSLYNRTWRATGPDKDLNGNGQIDEMEIFNALVYPLAGEFGNVHMKPERTTNFEVGFDYNFYGDYVLGLTAFYKDQEGTLSSGGSDFFIDEPVFGFNSSYTHAFFNRRFATSRGFELSLPEKIQPDDRPVCGLQRQLGQSAPRRQIILGMVHRTHGSICEQRQVLCRRHRASRRTGSAPAHQRLKSGGHSQRRPMKLP